MTILFVLAHFYEIQLWSTGLKVKPIDCDQSDGLINGIKKDIGQC